MNGKFFGLKLNTRCDPETQKLVTSMTFEDLITTQNGVAAARALVNVVIDQQIGQQISVRNCHDAICIEVTNYVQVDTISEVLQQRCGSFCSTDDVMLYKVSHSPLIELLIRLT